MIIQKDEIEKVKKHESRFISFKYIDFLGSLLQIDTSSHNVSYDIGVNLKTIPDKSFRDPFRSMPTTTFFCEKIEDSNIRTTILNATEKLNPQIPPPFVLKIAFWPEDADNPEHQSNKKSLLYASPPLDKYANLRSDIVEVLEDINIKCTAHYHGETVRECVIGIIGNSVVDLADNFIISKFIIENVAESYGKKVSFSNGNYNLVLELVIEENIREQFIQNIKTNALNIFSLFSYVRNDNSPLLPLKFEKSGQTIKILLKAAGTFNPYLAFGLLILHGVISHFSSTNLFDNTILSRYKTLIDSP